MASGESRIPVVCLCGTYLKADPEAIGKVKTCPCCRATVEVRRSDTMDGPFSMLFLKAMRIRGKGKARWKLSDGFEGFVEEIALNSFEDRGWRGLWGENALWEFLMALLFWDVFFAQTRGAWVSRYALGSAIWEQDMPYDWGKAEFYERRKSLITDRLAYLRSANLNDEIAKVYSENYGRRCRPIWNWDRFSANQLASVATALPRAALLQVTVRLLIDYGQLRSGIPDLFLWRQGRCAFVEVKGPRDRLSKRQVEWLSYLHNLGLRAFVVRVEEETDSPRSQL